MIRQPAKAVYISIFLLLLLGVLHVPRPVHAAISACSYSFDATEFPAGTQSTPTITINNDDPDNHIRLIRITRPSEQYVYNQVDTSWTVSPTEYDVSSATIQMSDGDVGPGISFSAAITFTAGSATGTEYWVVYVTDNSDGSNLVQCTGSSGTTIFGNTPTPSPESTETPTPTLAPDSTATPTTTSTPTPTLAPGTTATPTTITAPGTTSTPTPTPTPIPDASPPVISVNRLSSSTFNVAPVITGSASDDQSVTNISYSLNNGTTWNTVVIKTGKTVQYTFTPAVAGDGLYSLRVRARDAAGNSVVTDIVPFTVDRTLPTLTLDTDMTKPFKIAPRLTGIAADETGIVSVEASVDSGDNWLQSQSFDVTVNKRVFFSVVLPTLDDGNYTVRLRTTDIAGNVYVTPLQTMVIDRLPPRIGSVVLLLGPHVLEPKGMLGMYELSERTKVTVVAQAVGGPTELVLSAVSVASNQTLKFPFVKNPDTGLWSVVLEVPDSGSYTVSIHAIDGAGNTGDATIGGWNVKDPGIVETQNHTPVTAAKIRVYVFDSDTNSFLLWDAESFGGVNPQMTDENGAYHLLLPPGTYYMTVEKSGYRSIRTSIITLTEPTILSSVLTISKGYVFSIGSWSFTLPAFLSPFEEVKIEESVSMRNSIQQTGSKKIPQTLLSVGNQKGQGGPLHIVFIPLFHPQIASQLQVLERLYTSNASWNTVVVLTQGSQAEAGVLTRQGKYTLPIIADPDGELTNVLGIWSTPMHYFVLPDGKITGQIVGLLLEREIVDNRLRYSQ